MPAHLLPLLLQGTVFFVEPTNCGRGQILVVNVACEGECASTLRIYVAFT